MKVDTSAWYMDPSRSWLSIYPDQRDSGDSNPNIQQKERISYQPT